MKKQIIKPTLLLLSLFALVTTAFAAPQKNLDSYWLANNPLSTKQIHYPVWKAFLKNYVSVGRYQNWVNYKAVSKQEFRKLEKAIQRLEGININAFNRNQQLAYWINLYNMETVALILEHYPVKSILKIGGSFFSRGPWDQNVLKVEGRQLSLNDVDHRIIRPVWNDPRIHAAVNCASMGCPNLLPQPYHGKTINTQLNQAFKAFINNPRKGFKIQKNTVYLSKLFSWYGDDFGSTQKERLAFIKDFLSKSNLERINAIRDPKVKYLSYDWNLNTKS